MRPQVGVFHTADLIFRFERTLHTAKRLSGLTLANTYLKMGDSKNSTDWSDLSTAHPIVLSDLQIYSYTVLGATSLLAGLVLLLA